MPSAARPIPTVLIKKGKETARINAIDVGADNWKGWKVIDEPRAAPAAGGAPAAGDEPQPESTDMNI